MKHHPISNSMKIILSVGMHGIKAHFYSHKKSINLSSYPLGTLPAIGAMLWQENLLKTKKIAKLLNNSFISIKVDREEMPQIDALYQNIFLHLKKRSGGWPLSVFMTPTRKVFYITGYIPPKKTFYSKGFVKLIAKLSKLYDDKEALQKRISFIEKSVASPAKISVKEDGNVSLSSLSKSLKKSFDTEDGGFGEGRKFPQSSKLSLMMDVASIKDDKALKTDSFKMLDMMALRGIYDHVGGGFFRYSVNENWEIPHFEKMLYNQAELIPLYVRGYNIRHKKLYKNIVHETIAMVNRRFSSHSLYWSASSAESRGKEGAYFTFTPKEIQSTLKTNPHAKEIEDALGFSMEGNFKNRVVINFETQERPRGFTKLKKALLELRAKRKYPFIDKKINTAWNAMMIEALYKASVLDKKYEKMADADLSALENLMFQRGELYHQTIPNVAPTQKGLLEDYSFFISALIAGYEVDFDEKKLDFSEYLLSVVKSKFYKNGVWYLSADALNVKAGLNDKYYTSPLSKMLQNIIKIAAIKASFRYEELARKSIKSLKGELRNKQADVPALVQAYLMQKLGVVVIKSSKENLIKNAKDIQKTAYPYILSKAKKYDDFLACTLRQCYAKSKEIKNIVKVINKDFTKR